MESNYIIQIFEAAGYNFIGKDTAKKIILFYHDFYGSLIEFPFSEKTSLLDVLATITKKSYEMGFDKAQKQTRIEMKLAIGLL